VPQLVDEMCDHVNQHWHQSGIYLAAYLLWRVNWIHPFSDGNGRTARAIAYLVLCAKLRQRLPGDRTIPDDFISGNKAPYYAGLEAADEAWSKGKLDVSALEDYLGKLLADQVTRAASASEEPPAQVPAAPMQKREIDLMAEALGVARSAVDVASKKNRDAHFGLDRGGATAIVAALIRRVRDLALPRGTPRTVCPERTEGVPVPWRRSGDPSLREGRTYVW
jgi:Fic/DOC family